MIRIGNNNAEILPTTIQAETSQHPHDTTEVVMSSEPQRSILTHYQGLNEKVLRSFTRYETHQVYQNPALEPLPLTIEALPLPSNSVASMQQVAAIQQFSLGAGSKNLSGVGLQLSSSSRERSYAGAPQQRPSFSSFPQQQGTNSHPHSFPAGSLNSPSNNPSSQQLKKGTEAHLKEKRLKTTLEEAISLLPEDSQSTALKKSLTKLRDSLTQDHQSTEDGSKLRTLLTTTDRSISEYIKQLENKSLVAPAPSAGKNPKSIDPQSVDSQGETTVLTAKLVHLTPNVVRGVPLYQSDNQGEASPFGMEISAPVKTAPPESSSENGEECA